MVIGGILWLLLCVEDYQCVIFATLIIIPDLGSIGPFEKWLVTCLMILAWKSVCLLTLWGYMILADHIYECVVYIC